MQEPGTTAPDLFNEEELNLYQLEEAPLTKRFLNYVIDLLVMRYGLTFLTGNAVVQLLLAVAPDMAYRFFGTDRSLVDVFIGAYILGIFNYLIYYMICEKLFRGYTLGKLITGTRAVREDGQELTFRDALMRTLCRLVPLEPFSGLSGFLWHDAWTRTTVINSRR